MKNLFASLFVAVVLMTFSSCESEEVQPQAYADAYIIARQSDDATVYGLGLLTYANTDMTSVEAEGPDAETYDLDVYSSYAYEYYWETELIDYTESLPTAGNFTFDVVFKNGETQTLTETLTSTYLAPATFTTCEWDAESSTIKLAWDDVSDDADFGTVILRNTEDEIVWMSQRFAASTVSGSISASSSWISGSDPVSGATYTVELSIFANEASDSNHTQAKAITMQDVVWNGND